MLRGGDSPVTVHLDGGELTVDVDEALHVDLTGWAVPVYRGELSEEFRRHGGRMMLLVTGATGTTGMEVLRALKARGAEARALVRDETKAHHLRDLGFEPTTGDLGDPRTLGPALEGVERAYLVSPIGPMQSEFEQAFLETAKEAGVKHVVKLSVIGASPGGAAALRPHAREGRAARSRSPGMAWTLLRPTGFMQNTLAWGARVLDGTFYSPVPDAAFSIVDARDVAEVAAVALTEDGHEGKAYGLSGPEAVSYRDQARRVFAAAGREIEVEEIPVETLKRELVRAGVPPWNAEGLVELFEVYAGGGAQMVTSGVKDVLDRDPRDIDAFAAGPRGLVQGAALSERSIGRRPRDVLGRPRARGLLSGPAARGAATGFSELSAEDASATGCQRAAHRRAARTSARRRS